MRSSSRALSIVLTLAILVGSLFSLASCTPSMEKYTRTELTLPGTDIDIFGTMATVIGYAESEEKFAEVADLVFERLYEYHRLFDIHNSYEGLVNLHTVNSLDENGDHPILRVDSRIIDMLLYAGDVYEFTEGEVNVCMGSVLSIWHEYREAGRRDPQHAKLPGEEQLAAAAEHTSFSSLYINEQTCEVQLTDPAALLDVGAVAKGYTVELIASELEAMGVSGYTLNVGGNVRTVGTRADGTPWRVGIEDPRPSALSTYAKIVSLTSSSLVTSGSYQRYYYVNGTSYHHIIDKDTLMPASHGYLSVSVTVPSSAEADALSTALFAMPMEEGIALAESRGASVYYILEDGSIYETP